jgi:hypothetical protein
LGLAIVRRASTMLGHRLDVESTPGQGSAFSVLPLAEARSEKGDTSRPRCVAPRAQSLLVIDNDRPFWRAWRLCCAIGAQVAAHRPS